MMKVGINYAFSGWILGKKICIGGNFQFLVEIPDFLKVLAHEMSDGLQWK